MRIALLLAAAVAARAQTSPDVLDLLRDLAQTLTAQEPDDFLDHFDKKMPGYDVLRDNVRALTARSELGSSIEIVTDDGDDRRRMLQLDWLLQVDRDPPRRQILKCTLERQGKKWKIVALAPLDFFKP